MPCLPCSLNGLYRIWVGLVGQPQCLPVELFLQLGLSGVQGCELLPNFPAMGPQALILGVLDRAKRVTLGESQGYLHERDSALLAGPHADTRVSSQLGKIMQTMFRSS